MRHTQLAGIMCLTASFLGGTIPALAQEPSAAGLKQGMPYADARRTLINQGWQANSYNPNRKNELQQALQAYFIRNGFTEIEECQPTGSGLCAAAFHSGSGGKLYVFTAEPDEDDAKVVSWCLGGRGVNCSR